eukprot:TRINITY_DN26728_c0_g1_i1.p1 TRINITY_DN26728_c0_g1~~TRINITY_DN26728_c0_g1_i1.p1  ORF type:complete len:291 (+),score=74.25 TRINITY_DN26728_c0_g1_i1:81-875(+)
MGSGQGSTGRSGCACSCVEVAPGVKRNGFQSDRSGSQRSLLSSDDGSSSSSSAGSSRPVRTRGLAIGARHLPDASMVAHVHVDSHLEVTRELEAAQRRCVDLSAEVNRLREGWDASELALRKSEGESRKLAEGKLAAEEERDRLLRGKAESNEAVAQSALDARQLKRQLEEAKAVSERLERRLRERGEELDAAKAEQARLQGSLVAQRRELQALRNYSCAECRLKAYDFRGAEAFFAASGGRSGSGSFKGGGEAESMRRPIRAA